jgi:hypothetical protein
MLCVGLGNYPCPERICFWLFVDIYLDSQRFALGFNDFGLENNFEYWLTFDGSFTYLVILFQQILWYRMNSRHVPILCWVTWIYNSILILTCVYQLYLQQARYNLAR